MPETPTPDRPPAGRHDAAGRDRLRRLGHGMDPAVVAAIDGRLAGVATDHGVAIPWAIESGSRAWGFPSPDSDYDARFFFVRPVEAYAAPWRPRDVIETPLDAVLDVNGWDLVKAVRLAAGGNATVGEWLRSPLVYDGAAGFRDELLSLTAAVADPVAVARHYVHVGRAQWTRAGADLAEPVVLKRVFYALRPALVLHWMARHGGVGTAADVAPMNVAELLDGAPPPAAVVDEVDRLVARKAVTRELGRERVPPVLVHFVRDQLWAWEDRLRGLPRRDPAPARREASRRFADLVREWAP